MNDLPSRKPNRLSSFHYATDGGYFITICTQEHRQILSQIRGTPEDGCHVETTRLGKLVEAAICSIPEHYEGAFVDRYVIMPNHVHLLLILRSAGGRLISAPTVVGSMKRDVSKVHGASIWQKGFYDHVIRSEADYLAHLLYIDENPVKWVMGKDEYYA